MRYVLPFLVLLFLTDCHAQLRFQDEIDEFKKNDTAQPPPKQAILFVGSSSFRLWTDMQESFPDHIIINRGFGGATLPDLLNFQNDIIFPYEPRQVIIYCGENDLASGASAADVFANFRALFENIRQRLPEASVAFVSMKPSPSREQFALEMQKGNDLIKSFLKKKKRTNYIDVYALMLDSKGKPRPELFVEDELHMNKNGYAIWQKAIQPVLK